jgi:hypothetical protein
MGTRLYYESKVISEEVLAGVPEGTAELLSILESMRPRGVMALYLGDEDAWHDLLEENPNLLKLYTFRLFGYGKINGQVHQYLKDHGFSPECGATSDPAHIREILILQDVGEFGFPVSMMLEHPSTISWS